MALSELIVPLRALPRRHTGPRLDRAGVLCSKREVIRRLSPHLAVSLLVSGSAWSRGMRVDAPCALIHRPGEWIALRPEREIDEAYIVFNGSEAQVTAAAGIVGLPERATVDATIARRLFDQLRTFLPLAHSPGVADILDHLALGWLSWLASDASSLRRPAPGAAQETAEAWLLAHLHEPLDLPAAAQRAGSSPATLRRHWHQRHGLSPAAWLARERMRHAEHLLANTDLPLLLIAHRCGYGNARHFSTAFSRTSGMPPGRWRDRLR